MQVNDKTNNEIDKKIEEELIEQEQDNTTDLVVPRKGIHVLTIFGIFTLLFILAIMIFSIAFSFANIANTKIYSGVYVFGIDVSNLTKDASIQKVNTELSSYMPTDIILKHNDFETNLNLEQINAHFQIDEAVEKAYSVGRFGNSLKNNFQIIYAKFNYINIEPSFSYNEKELVSQLENISTQLPDTVKESSYYIEDTNLIITPGTAGNVISIEQMKNYLVNELKTLNCCKVDYLNIITTTKEPEKIDIEKIYKEVYKNPVDAYYTSDPFVVYPSETGLDFNISIDEAQALISQNTQEEYLIPLKILQPSITTNMIGTEAFPNLLATFSTNYIVSNKNRTTNLILAANKINGTVLVPGEIFSYNTVVGARTIAAGYKEAAIYLNGQVVDGLGGGICQISSTLFNAVLYSNLEIVERRNHQFVPSYVKAGRDATVVYGSQDFKFKNTRNYAIKIECSVSSGVVTFNIYGVKEDNECTVEITSGITSRTSNYIHSITYRTLKQNGQIISNEIIAKDTYKAH